MAREPTCGKRVIHIIYTGEPIPHTGVEPYLHRHPYTNEAKEWVQFWSFPKGYITTFPKSTPPGSPNAGPVWKQTPISRALFNMTFRVPSKGALPPGPLHGVPQR